jgi:protein-tyrosine phosphatase
VLDPNNTLPTDIENAIVNKDYKAQAKLLENGRAERLIADQAAFLTTGKAALKAYGALMDRLTDPASLPAFTHCTQGKDRTGWSTAVILTALGVSKQTVMEDYLLTNTYAAAKNEDRIESAKELMTDSELLRPLLEARPVYLNASFKDVTKKYGTFANYLEKGLGVSKGDLKKLKQNLLTD